MVSNFNFYNPVKIIFGEGTIAKLSKNIPLGSKVMVCYGGGSIKKNGVYNQTITALKGYEVIEFDGIEVNPVFETLMKAVQIGRIQKVDFLLGVGGGSVIDGVKFISAAIPYIGADEWGDIVLGKTNYKTVIPFGVVITLPATGTEMNYFSVISRKETKEKYGMGLPVLYPVFSILDPTTTYSLPKVQLANGLADAFTHVMEQYMTYPVNALVQDKFAESILKTLIEIAPKVLQDSTNYDNMSNFMWAATVALNGWISPGVPQDWATHQIGHELTALHGIDHARTLAIVLPHLMRFKMESKKAKMIQYAKEVWHATGTDDELSEIAIQKTIQFYESLGIPTKASAYTIDLETIEIIKERFLERKAMYGEHKDIDPDAVESILRMSLH